MCSLYISSHIYLGIPGFVSSIKTVFDIIKMLECLVDNIFVDFAGKFLQQIFGILMGTNCVPLLADIFLY